MPKTPLFTEVKDTPNVKEWKHDANEDIRVIVSIVDEQNPSGYVVEVEAPDGSRRTLSTSSDPLFTNKLDAIDFARDWIQTYPYADLDEVFFKEARELGYRKAPSSMGPEQGSVDEAVRDAQAAYPQSADWANNVLPALRRIAGCTDSGHGTYRECPEPAHFMVNDLVDHFWRGYRRKLEE